MACWGVGGRGNGAQLSPAISGLCFLRFLANHFTVLLLSDSEYRFYKSKHALSVKDIKGGGKNWECERKSFWEAYMPFILLTGCLHQAMLEPVKKNENKPSSLLSSAIACRRNQN